MKLSANILKNFAKQVSKKEENNTPTTFYGTVVSKDDTQAIVHLDGSTIDTPVDCAMDVEPNDRVMVQIINHKAVVIGNTTSPASARTANAYMRMIDDGLVIGKLNDSDMPTYLFLSGDTYYIKRQLGETVNPSEDDTLAAFASTIDLLGAIISGYEVQRPNPTDPSETITVAGIEISAELIQLVSTWHRYPVVISLDQGISMSCFGTIDFYSDQGVPTANGVSLATVNDISQFVKRNEIFKTGSIQASDTIPANSYKTITTSAISVPAGYSLLGIRSITTNHSSVCHMTQFQTNMTDKKVSATFHNDSSSAQATTVTFYYFCIRSS